MRVRTVKHTDIRLTPAGFELPDEIENIQAAQAMIPVTSRDEMRGEREDTRIDGEPNEIAKIPEGQFEEIWSSYFDRLLSIEKYRKRFRAVYDTDPKQLSFGHAANAIAAYQIEAFTLLNSPWDRYLEGDTNALGEERKRGARLFYGKGNCSQCHTGPLMTDQEAHNIGVPQLGPGKEPDEPYDLGFYSQTGDPEDRFAFRTPPLRNVTVTGPWMHNGAYKTLRAAVEHHLHPRQSLRQYRADQLSRDLRRTFEGPLKSNQLDQLPPGIGESLIPTVRTSEKDIELVLGTLDPELRDIQLTNDEVDAIMSFLKALTSPDVRLQEGILSGRLRRTIPDTVPSELPVSFPGEESGS
jgi:cytochrome c peroxidase